MYIKLQIKFPINMDKLSESIIKAMQAHGEPMLTIDIAKALGYQTRSQVNPKIYELEKAGKVIKVQAQPPIWKLTEHKSNKHKVLCLTEGSFISLADAIPLLENKTLNDIIYYSSNNDNIIENDEVNYQTFSQTDDYTTLFFCNTMLLTADESLEVYVCYDESLDTLKRLFSLPLITKSDIKIINSLHELV